MERIIFSKPNIKELKSNGYLCADIHFHSLHSDGAASVDQIIAKARMLGVGVAITDHNEISGALEAFEKKQESDFIIPGIEVKSKETIDILFYFYDKETLKVFYEKEIKPKKERYFHSSKTSNSLEDLHRLSKKYYCIASVAHPFGYSLRTSVGNIFEKNKNGLALFSTVEAINGGNKRKQNKEAISYISENKKCFTGGSDGHSIYGLGRIVTCAKAGTLKGFLDSIASKQNIVIGKESSMGKIGEYGRYALNKIGNILKK